MSQGRVYFWVFLVPWNFLWYIIEWGILFVIYFRIDCRRHGFPLAGSLRTASGPPPAGLAGGPAPPQPVDPMGADNSKGTGLSKSA